MPLLPLFFRVSFLFCFSGETWTLSLSKFESCLPCQQIIPLSTSEKKEARAGTSFPFLLPHL